MDDSIFNNKIVGNSKLANLTVEQEQDFNNKVKGYTDTFKANNFTLAQAQQYIKTNNANSNQFNKYYHNHGQGIIDNATNLTQQIMGQFLNPTQKLDLDLTTSITT